MLPPNLLLMLLCLLTSVEPLMADTAAEGLRTSRFDSSNGVAVALVIVVTPVNLFRAPAEAVIPPPPVEARFARELMLRDMAACCCCCLTNAASLFCDCALVVAFFAELLLPAKVPLVALITVFRSVEAARVGALSMSAVEDDATLNLYGIPSRSGRVTRMTTVFFSGGISRTVFCKASWSSETARRSRFARGGSLLALVMMVLLEACRS